MVKTDSNISIWHPHMVFRNLSSSVFLMVLTVFCLLSSVSHSQQQVNYQTTLINEGATSVNLTHNIYLVYEKGTPLTLPAVETLVRARASSIIQNTKSHINLREASPGLWLIFPVTNNSAQDIWKLDLGSFLDGRISSYKDILLYNMNTRKVLIDTQSSVGSEQSVPSSIALNLPQQKTTFFILYLKSNVAAPTLVSPTLAPIHQQDFSANFMGWFFILLGSGGAFYFLKSFQYSRSYHKLAFAALWVLTSFAIYIPVNYIYFTALDSTVLYALLWVSVPLTLLLILLGTEDNQGHVSYPIFGGLAASYSVLGCVATALLPSYTHIALPLLFLLSLSALLLSTTFHGLLTFVSNRRIFAGGFVVSGLLFLTFLHLSLVHFDIIELSLLNHTLFAFLLISAIIVSLILDSTSVLSENFSADEHSLLQAFSETQINKKDVYAIQDAKEQSEHRRLLQVIDQERKVMSDLQIKTAKQNEDMRKAKETADEANRAKSAFLAIVSHEIRTPMTGIMGMLRLLQDTQLSKEQKEYASTIKDSSDAMLSLLNDILDFEKIESGKMNLEYISFDLKRLIKGVYTLMRGHAESKNVELALEVADNIPSWVLGDPTRLRQVLLNLLNNAIKFTSKGVVYFRVRDLTGDNSDDKTCSHQIYFAVQDSGIGISLEGQRKLFMPFAQADNSISRKYGGTGLGLAICKRLIEAMGGAISISSKENEGSTFFFTLAMTSGNEDIINADSAEDATLSKSYNFKSNLRVLVVDDNGINQKVVMGFAQKLGADCKSASSGQEALTMVSKHTFDLILMDLQLPDMSGIEVTQRIRQLPNPLKSTTPIVGLSGNTSAEDVQMCFDNGMQDFAAKPITFERILELLINTDTEKYPSNTLSRTDLHFVEGTDDLDSDFSSVTFQASSNTPPLTSPPTSHNTLFNGSNLELDEDEEDSFALAVKQFEDMERQLADSVAPKTIPTQPDSLEDFGLDESILSSLRSGLSIIQIQEILVGFYEKANELIADIGNAYIEKNEVALHARAHELKGMAGNFGFSELSRMCAVIEKAAKTKDFEGARVPIENLGECYAMARNRLNLWLTKN